VSAVAAVFPRLRWFALAWLALWIPIYWFYWGGHTFFLLCDVSLVLGCLGLFSGNALLVSTQAVATPVVGVFWGVDLAWRFFLGRHLIGGTEYMWDTRFPLWVRLASFFHLALPMALIWALRRVGYDRRAWLAQSGIAATLLAASRLIDPARNLNFAFRDPLLHRSLGPAPVHLTIILGVLLLVLYAPVHLILSRAFPPPAQHR
jgi:hypothetical protein